MAGRYQKKKTSALGVFRLIVLLVVIGCGIYMAGWLYGAHAAKKNDKDVAEKYIRPIENTAPREALPEPEESIPAEETLGPGESVEPTAGMTVDFDALRQEGKDVVAWLRIPSMDVIDYPVVWRDDFYYLDKDWTGKPSARGAIFLEEMNRKDFLDLHTILYGHNMRDDTMFGRLEEYGSKEFFEENGGTILIYTPDAAYTYEIFSVERVANSDERVYTVGFIQDEVYSDFLRGMKDRSLYDTGVDVSVNDRVLTLSTCVYEFDGARLAVHAKLVAAE